MISIHIDAGEDSLTLPSRNFSRVENTAINIVWNDGKHISRYLDGSIASECVTLNNKKEGEQRQWHRNGRLHSTRWWREGEKCGKETTWHLNGKLRLTRFWMKHKKTGKETRWYWDGKLRLTSVWLKDKKIGKETTWHPNGKLATECFWLKGVREGCRKRWFSDGQLQSMCFFRDDEKDGKEMNWYKGYFSTPSQSYYINRRVKWFCDDVDVVERAVKRLQQNFRLRKQKTLALLCEDFIGQDMAFMVSKILY